MCNEKPGGTLLPTCRAGAVAPAKLAFGQRQVE